MGIKGRHIKDKKRIRKNIIKVKKKWAGGGGGGGGWTETEKR